MLFDDTYAIGYINVLGATAATSGGGLGTTAASGAAAFSGGGGSFGGGGGGGGVTPSSTDVTVNNTFDVNARKFQVLYSRVMTLLEPYLNYYKTGDLDTLFTTFTSTEYLEIAVELQTTTYYSPSALGSIIYDNQTFQNFINRIIEFNDGLFQASNEYSDHQACKARLQELEEILSDADRLLEYYAVTFEGTGNLADLDAAVDTGTGPVIKAEYIIYIERHGFPVNGNFDSGLLGAIILELENP